MEALKSQPSFVDKAFVSTSSDFDTAKGFSWGNGSGVLEIEIPKGAKAFSTIEHGSSSYENELLLNRNSSFKVTGNKIIDGKPVLQLKMIQEEDDEAVASGEGFGTASDSEKSIGILEKLAQWFRGKKEE